MKGSERCSNCTDYSQDSKCDCVSRAASFFQILLQVDQRVSIANVTSIQDAPSVAAHFDKLILELFPPLSKKVLFDRLRCHGLPSSIVMLRDRQWYLQIGSGNHIIHLSAGGAHFPFCRKLIAKPSAFSNYKEFYHLLTKILTPEEIQQAQVKRIDAAVDYQVGFGELLKGFDLRGKQKEIAYQNSSGVRTGVIIGKGAEKVLVYDKALESNRAEPLTRIEVQVSGGKLPSRSLPFMENLLSSGGWNPLKEIRLSSIQVLDGKVPPNAENHSKVVRFSALLEREGFFSTKRALNVRGNFLRDYSRYFRATPYAVQPSEAFTSGMSEFFASVGNEENHE